MRWWPAALFLQGVLLTEDDGVDVQVDGGRDQALKQCRLQNIHFPAARGDR